MQAKAETTETTESPRRSRKPRKPLKTVTDAVADGEYTTEHAFTIPERGAHFLDWAASSFPKQYVPYNYCVKAVMGYAKTPRLDSEEVDKFRTRLTRIRQVLQDKYGRELDSQPGVGIRATVDDADVTTVTLPKKMMRFRSAKAAVSRTVSLIDPSKLPNTADMAPWKKWLSTSVRDVIKTLESPEFEKKLLPPALADDDVAE